MSQTPSLVRTPRPTPQFFHQAQTFSTKKARGTPRDALPPRSPVKSAPPISRIFPHKTVYKAQPVSFKHTHHSFLSPHYNERSKESYFAQCFEIQDKLGCGAFGEVFKVRSKEDGKLYAVKRSVERFRGECDRKRKLQEVAKMEKLPKHPNCVGFVKAWEEKQHLYLLTELCQTSLEEFSEKNHQIPEKLIWNYLVDLLMAVKHLHDHDLVHMDIKPANIFIGFDDTCKLGDFGLVLEVGTGSDFSEAQEGDPCYMAPELLAGQFGKPADVFSLGMTILELASDLDLPQGGEAWHHLRSGNLPEQILGGISSDLRQCIQSMLVPDPGQRSTVNDLLARECVKTVWKRRQREKIFKNVIWSIWWGIQGLLSFFLTLWMTLVSPLQSLLPQPQCTTPQKTDGSLHPPDLDRSFSEDDTLDDSISIANNSMGAPLNLSSSSEESVSNGGFVLPSIPVRRAQTTPALRTRPRYFNDHTPTASSPVLQMYANFRSSSPLRTPASITFNHTDDSITPDSSFHEQMIVDEPKVNIEPKNLLEAFESASSEDD